MKNIILFGAPGAGKGTQSKILLEKYDFAYVSTGELLRSEIKKGSPLGRQAETIINQGKLVSDELIINIVHNFIQSNNSKSILLDGFPRTVKQAEALDEILKELKRGEATVIELKVPQQLLMRRLLNRAKIEGRKDDNEQTILSRFKEYEQKTAAVANYYKSKNAFIEVDGSSDDLNEINQKICQAIDTLKD